MRKTTLSGFDTHLQKLLAKNPKLAQEYSRQFAELSLSAQLAIIRRRRWLSQQTLARTLRVKQPHVARVESSKHDPRLSSLDKQAKALHCRLMVVPDELLAKVAQLVSAGGEADGDRSA